MLPILVFTVAVAFVSPTLNVDAFSVSPPPPVPQEATVLSTSPLTREVAQVSSLPSQRQLLASSTALIPAAAPTVAPVATPAVTPALNAISITNIQYDGRVPTTEADEYVVVTNGSKSPIDVSGYSVYVATSGSQGATFTFPQGSTIKAGLSVRIYTNEIHQESGGYSFGSGKAIWNNRGGVAVLKDASGKKIGEYKYLKSSPS